MDKRRVVITGMGALTPIGHTAEESWAAVRRGECGIAPITGFDTRNHRVKLAGEIKGFSIGAALDPREAKKMARFTQLALIAAGEAYRDSGLEHSRVDPSRCGVLVSSGIGGLDAIEAEHRRAMEKGYERISPYFIPMAIGNMAAGHIAIRYGCKGMCGCVVTACAGGSNAVGDAMRHIRDGYADVMICGGAESCVTPLGIGGFASMKALTLEQDPARACIPFDAERSGFVMGEGSGILVLEELGHALRRGARIHAEVLGYGISCDAYHITAPAPDGEGGAACMRLALEDAGLAPERIDYINAHGTSTRLNDACETAAIKEAFGPHARRLCVSSTKSMTGHLLGAAGAVEAIFTAQALRDGFVPATIHYRQSDPACDLDVVPGEGRERPLRYAMSNSLGFGGHNASLVLGRWEE